MWQIPAHDIQENPSVSIKLDNVKELTFRELALATNNFCSPTIVGRGGYGNVYRGTLSGGTLWPLNGQQKVPYKAEKSF
ncbi:hypothetical protein Fmac_004795 [Flemingia macrophylla]|uniref:Uncharacterized protein n=1 Tax=Flemingia macrophylla TaxID=520843 RepID=A0ABD1N609_9FABA